MEFCCAVVIQNETEFKSQAAYERMESSKLSWVTVLPPRWTDESPRTPI